MTDWIEHTGDTCPVDPETVVEVHYRNGLTELGKAAVRRWTDALEITTCLPSPWNITHYRIVTPAKLPELEMVMRSYPTAAAPGLDGQNILRTTIGAQMPKTHEDYTGPTFGVPTKPEPDLITLRLECLKLAVKAIETGARPYSPQSLAEGFLHYVLNGSVDKA